MQKKSTATRAAAAVLVALLSVVGVNQAAGGPAVVSADRPWCC